MVVTEKTEPLNFFVSKALKERIRTYADRHGLSLAGAVRFLVTQALDRAERSEQLRQN